MELALLLILLLLVLAFIDVRAAVIGAIILVVLTLTGSIKLQ